MYTREYKHKTVRGMAVLAALFSALIACPVAAMSGAKGEDIGVAFLEVPESVGRFGVLEADVDVRAAAANPFDSGELDIAAQIDGPAGLSVSVRLFYYQDFIRRRIGSDEVLEPKGRPVWKLRYAPPYAGDYRLYIRVRTKGKEVRTEERRFSVRASESKGFIRSDGASYVKYDSGDIFFGIGENVAWANGSGKKDYADLKEFDSYIEKLSANGANLIRAWMSWWAFGIEWTGPGAQHYGGLGRYSLKNSWRLDHVMREAQAKGINVILVLDSYFVLMTEKGFWGEEQWEKNPYNVSCGGPCRRPADFWTDPAARSAYKKRLDYIIARWGAYSNLAAFELWNELNAPVAWVKEMSEYIKKADPHRHMITISLGELSFDGFSEDGIWKLPAVDFTQAHIYGSGGEPIDLVDRICYKSDGMRRRYDKPYLTGEYGIDWSKTDAAYDKNGQGIHVHNCLWAGLFSGSMAGAMNWWWDSYIDVKNLYGIYAPFSSFVRGLTFRKDGWSAAQCRVRFGVVDSAAMEDISVQTIDEWGAKDERVVEILNDGSAHGGRPNKYLHAAGNNKGMAVSPVFKVDYPRAGKFIVKVGTVSVSSMLNIYLDDKLVLSRKFPGKDESGKHDWKQRTYRRMFNIYQYEYGIDIAISVPAGRHVIRLENADGDWLSIDDVRLTGYKKQAGADLRVFGLRSGTGGIFWVQDRKSDWFDAYRGRVPRSVNGAVLEVMGMPDGLYEIEWYDTWKGQVTARERKSASGNILSLNVPLFARDIACKAEMEKG